MKTNKIPLFIVITALLIAGCSTAYKGLQASLPDLGGKPDGVYRGKFDVSGTPVNVVLEVTIQNELISSIRIISHMCSPIGKKAEEIIERIILKQSLDVDVVSGATASSKGILKAVEDALQ